MVDTKRLLTDEEIKKELGDSWAAFPMSVFHKLDAAQDAKIISIPSEGDLPLVDNLPNKRVEPLERKFKFT